MATILARPSFFPSASQISKLSFVKMATGSSSISTATGGKGRKLPILLFDVMDTLVRDPFYEDVPAFFRMPFKELLETKHPTAWIEFENGLINEVELGKRKPASEFYSHVSHHLAVDPGSCIFIDDRVANVEAAVNAGMVGLHFKNAASLQRDLALLGIETCSLSTN